jgi:hypothetical protein
LSEVAFNFFPKRKKRFRIFQTTSTYQLENTTDRQQEKERNKERKKERKKKEKRKKMTGSGKLQQTYFKPESPTERKVAFQQNQK